MEEDEGEIGEDRDSWEIERGVEGATKGTKSYGNGVVKGEAMEGQKGDGKGTRER